MAETNRVKYVFAVKEHLGGEPFIALEPSGGSLEILRGGLLTLDLREGVSLEQARRLAGNMNDRIDGLAYTPK